MSSVFAALISQLPSSPAAAANRSPVSAKDVKGVKVKDAPPTKHLPEWTATNRELTEDNLPPDPPLAASTQVISLSVPTTTASVNKASGKGTRVGTTPVYVAPASDSPPGAKVAAVSGAKDAAAAGAVKKVRVEVLDRKGASRLGVDGLAMRISRADGVNAAGKATVTVDYGQIAGKFGTDALARLKFVRLSDGAVIASANNATAKTLSASVPLAAGGTVTALAVAAAAEGEGGSYKASSLSAASTWHVSQQTGAFSWSYPFEAPAPPSGVAPSLGLSYSSAAIDGLTSGNNTQGSWIGDGWDMWPGYIERSYRSCVDDRDEKEKKDPNNGDRTSKDQNGGDLCYFDDNATMSFNGSASELVKVGSSDGGAGDKSVQYRSVSDDGSRIELVKAGNGNGDADGAYWRVTDTDGTQYWS